MTDMDHKPNGWNLPINQMTDEEWKDYFECRKKYDIKLSEQEIANNTNEAVKFINDMEEFKKIAIKNPLLPGMAIVSKAFYGLKSIKNYNLSLAKEVYPNEF